MAITELMIRNLPTPQFFERGEEAVDYALQNLATVDDAFLLAQSLREHNQPQEALKIAEHGLALDGEKLTLVRWVGKAQKAYLAANREQEWQTYLDSLINKHARKYSLRPQLEALR